MLSRLVLFAALMFSLPAFGQGGTVPGQFVVPMGFCQIPAATLASASTLTTAACVGASFTGSVATDTTQLTVTSVTGSIKIGQVVAGTGIAAGTKVTGQVSGTPGGAGTYQLSATNTASAASLTSGGIPLGATMAYLDAVTTLVRFRDDGGVPTIAIGSVIAVGNQGIFYTGNLAALQFISSASGVLNVSFYR